MRVLATSGLGSTLLLVYSLQPYSPKQMELSNCYIKYFLSSPLELKVKIWAIFNNNLGGFLPTMSWAFCILFRYHSNCKTHCVSLYVTVFSTPHHWLSIARQRNKKANHIKA